MTDIVLDLLCDELTRQHAAHTIFLYGSRANGSAGSGSDYDVAAFAPVRAVSRIARRESGEYLDVFIYPESVLEQPTSDHLALRGCKVLRQRDGQGEAFLRRLDAIHRAGPPPLSADEIEARRVWAHKMLSRIGRGDAEGDYRRVWLLQALLQDYFETRGMWFEGPKKALQALARSDVQTYDAYSSALRPGAGIEAISVLVRQVTGTHDA